MMHTNTGERPFRYYISFSSLLFLSYNSEKVGDFACEFCHKEFHRIRL